MSANDPLPEFPDQPPDEAVPPPPTEIMREPDLYGVTPEPTQPVVPAIPPLIRPRPPHPGFWWALLWTVLFIIVSQGTILLVSVPVILVHVMLGTDLGALVRGQESGLHYSPELANLLAPGLLVGEIASILFGWLALRLVAGKDWTRRVALRRPDLAHLGLALLLFPALVLVGSGMGELAKRLVPSLIDLEEMIKLLGCLPWWLAVLCVGFGPGIGEELWCRGFLGRGLVGHYGLATGMVLTSVLFGLMHIEPRQIVYAPVMGLILHFAYWTTRSLWVPMLLHTLNNSLGILAASKNFPAIRLVAKLDAAADKHPALVYGGAVVLLLAVCYALYQSRARLVALDGTEPPPWRPAYPGVEYPPPGSETRVAHPGLSWAAAAAAVAGSAAFVVMCYLAVVRG